MKPIEFKLDGKKRSLYFDWNTISTFEETFDISAPYAVQERRLGFASIRNFIWAGMLHENPDLDVKEVGNMLQKSVQSQENTLTDLADVMTKALKVSGILDVQVSDNPKG